MIENLIDIKKIYLVIGILLEQGWGYSKNIW